MVNLPLKEEPLAGQRTLQDGEVFVEAVALLGGIDLVAGELVLEIAGADAEHDAAAGQHVDHRVALRHGQRIVEGQDRDCGAQAQPLRALRQRRQHHRRVGDRAVFMEMVLGDEERVVAEAIRQLRLCDHLLIELRQRAGSGRIMVLDGKDR